ncbi:MULTISPECIES: hypothetical protein [Geobacter]|uniref:Uncharacterized protein n=2 Tax=Geobacter TaxID=28231 RepID=A0A0C1TUG9_9BACT|nr:MULTISPECIES: hypothetical protein [Geobacter]KIE43048.1 hypothetical protein SE37_10585 [Geobacter soli]MBE2886919.1 hypothetical protein [Geobacter anodireducens]
MKKLDAKMLEELGESAYRELVAVYCKLRDLKTSITRMHDDYVAQAVPPELNRVQAIRLIVDEAFDDLDRYLRPQCDPDSAYRTVERDE